MDWGWPQFVYAGLMMLGVGIQLAKHGETKTTSYNVFLDAPVTAVVAWILYEGGFWTP